MKSVRKIQVKEDINSIENINNIDVVFKREKFKDILSKYMREQSDEELKDEMEEQLIKVCLKEYKKLTGKSLLREIKNEDTFYELCHQLLIYYKNECASNPLAFLKKYSGYRIKADTEFDKILSSNKTLVMIAINFPIFLIGSALFENKWSITDAPHA